jgi:pSer/pThr/pTyr-binding forkhead associated (FHA) protein
MLTGNAQLQQAKVSLGEAAPRVRVTTGVGTAGQKTWNLRRPVTVIGSQRGSHIVLRDESISKSHCAIINDGHAVLLCDLHSRTGTRCNDQPVSVTLLNDGDVVQVGPTAIQVAINIQQRKDESMSGWRFADPLRQPDPLTVCVEWRGFTAQAGSPANAESRLVSIEQSVAVIGRSPSAALCLDHEDVSLAHALLFVLDGRAAICDLGSRKGLLINGERKPLALLSDGDRVAIGAFALGMRLAATQRLCASTSADPPARDVHAPAKPSADRPTDPTHSASETAAEYERWRRARETFAAEQTESEQKLSQRQAELEALAESLTRQRQHLESASAALDERRRALDDRSAQLDARQLRIEQRERRVEGTEAVAGPVLPIGVKAPVGFGVLGPQRPA